MNEREQEFLPAGSYWDDFLHMVITEDGKAERRRKRAEMDAAWPLERWDAMRASYGIERRGG